MFVATIRINNHARQQVQTVPPLPTAAGRRGRALHRPWGALCSLLVGRTPERRKDSSSVSV